MDLTVDNIVRVLQTVGFPAAVALWFMFRTDRKLEDLTKAVTDLTLELKK